MQHGVPWAAASGPFPSGDSLLPHTPRHSAGFLFFRGPRTSPCNSLISWTLRKAALHCCDDASSEVNPGARELCSDGVDNDCDDLLDDDDTGEQQDEDTCGFEITVPKGGVTVTEG